MSDLRCIVVTPEKTVRDEAADFVALPLFDGEIGIAPGKSPMIGRLGYGEMRIVRGGRTERYYVEAGFVEVIHNVVSVLTNRAVRGEGLDPLAARDRLTAALGRHTTSLQEMDERDRLVSQARAEIRVAQRPAGG